MSWRHIRTLQVTFFFSLQFQSIDLYKNEEIEYQLAAKQECFVWTNWRKQNAFFAFSGEDGDTDRDRNRNRNRQEVEKILKENVFILTELFY